MALGPTVTLCDERIARLRIGEGTASGMSWLAEPRPASTLGASGPSIVRLDPDGRLELGHAGAPPELRLSMDLHDGARLRLGFEATGEQHFYGLGHGGMPFDRLGATRRLWNCHVNHGLGSDIAIPLLLSNRGWGLFFDDPCRALLDPGQSRDSIGFDYVSENRALDVYFLAGDCLRATLGLLATLLGRATLPPRWALGYLQSTRHFEDRDELRRLVGTFRDKGLPCDALILLSTYGQARGWNKGVGHLEVEPGLFADAADLVAELKQAGLRVLTHEYPVLHEDSPLHREAVERGCLLDDAYPRPAADDRSPTTYHDGQRYVDFSRPEVGAWWWDRHEALMKAGVDGWWLDGGEGPAFDGGCDGRHNRFDLLRQQAFAEGEARDRPHKRPFLLCRSGGPGMQRFGAACWSGDVNATFATLEMQIGIGLNMGLSGVPWWGTDIGGYYPIEPESGELFARWFQFGAFSPIFRAHGRAWRRHLPWSHGPEIEAICRRYVELRYRLMPYTYSLAWQARAQGLPLMRPLVLNYPDDPKVWDLASAYLWGDDFLIAPVTREGATTWPAYLPKGRWHDFWTGAVYEGQRTVVVPAPLERLPLFVRSGAILPLAVADPGPDGRCVDLLVYPDERSRFTLYDDDGESRGYLDGACALTDLACVVEPNRITCRIEAPRGDASLVPEDRAYRLSIHVPSPPASVDVSGGDAREPSWQQDDQGRVTVTVSRYPGEVRLRW
jgi:alpha-glucosidase (family GH31 glycosyl hydrolase)